jgi:hypothetical protein
MRIRSGLFARAALAACLLLVWSPAAGAHSLLVVPKPRDQQDGYKDPPRAPPGTGAPCGVSRMVPAQPQTSYQPGAKLTVQWTETVNHPGCFVIDFAQANDANFQILGSKGHTGSRAPQSWSLDVTLPSTPCPSCTLRLRQLMLDADLAASACPPAVIPSGDTYYSCANVVIGSGSAGAGGAGSSAGGASSSAGGASPAGTAGAGSVAGAISTNGGAAESGAGAPGSGAGMAGTGAGASAGAGASTSNGSGGTSGMSAAPGPGANDGTSKAGGISSGGASAAPAAAGDPPSGGCTVSSPGGSTPTSLALLTALATMALARRRLFS